MPIFTGRDPLLLAGDPLRQESTFGEALSVGIEEALDMGGIGSLSRLAEIDLAEGEVQRTFGRAAASREAPGQALRPLSPILAPEDARKRLRDAGLSESLSVPESGIREDTLNILVERKREELRRRSILESYDGVAAPLLGSLFGSLADPTNIALAFVPVVGEARYAQLLARAGSVWGRTGVRVGVGGVEGLVGLAPVEALNYYANVQQQADYDAYDSMLAIAGGAFFGSTLHAGAGLLGDAIRFRPSRPAMIPEAAPERAPQIEPLAIDPVARERAVILDRLAEGKPVTTRMARAEREAMAARTGAQAGEVIDNRLSALAEAAADGRLDPAVVKALAAERDQIEGVLRAEDRALRQGILLSPERRLTPQERDFIEVRRQDIRSQLERHKAAQGAQKQLDTLQSKLAKIDNDSDLIRLADEIMPMPEGQRFVESLSAAIREALDNDPFQAIRPYVAQTSQETQAAAMRAAVAAAIRGEKVEVGPLFLNDPVSRDPAAAVALARQNVGKIDGASEEMSQWADSLKPIDDDVESLRATVADDEAMLSEQLAEAGVDLQKELEPLAEALAEARRQGEAARVAAYCLMRTGA